MTHIERAKLDVSPLFTRPTELSSKVARGLIEREDTPRAITYFSKHCSLLDSYSYWYLLGTCWVRYSGFSDLGLWKRLFSASVPSRTQCLMKPSECAAFESLPDPIHVYRAHRADEMDWIAYTLDPQIAAREWRKRPGGSVKLYELRRDDCIALFLRREEAEIIMLDKSRAIFLGDVEVRLGPCARNKNAVKYSLAD